MLIQFSIEGLGDELLSLPLEELSEKFIHAYGRGRRYSSRVRIGDDFVVYGSQPVTGILFDYTSLLKDLASNRSHEMLIDGFPVAEVELLTDQVGLDFGADRQGRVKKFVFLKEEYRQSLIDTIERISFGIYMIDMAEMAMTGSTGNVTCGPK